MCLGVLEREGGLHAHAKQNASASSMREQTLSDTPDASPDFRMLIGRRRTYQKEGGFGNQLFGAKIIARLFRIGVSVDCKPFDRLLGNVESMAETPYQVCSTPFSLRTPDSFPHLTQPCSPLIGTQLPLNFFGRSPQRTQILDGTERTMDDIKTNEPSHGSAENLPRLIGQRHPGSEFRNHLPDCRKIHSLGIKRPLHNILMTNPLTHIHLLSVLTIICATKNQTSASFFRTFVLWQYLQTCLAPRVDGLAVATSLIIVIASSGLRQNNASFK